MRQFGKDKNGADCSDIRPHLKQIDSLFEVVFNYDLERYEVYFNNGLFQTVPWNEFDKATIEHIRKMYWINVNGDPFKDVEESEYLREIENEKKRVELSKELAKDTKWALNKEGY